MNRELSGDEYFVVAGAGEVLPGENAESSFVQGGNCTNARQLSRFSATQILLRRFCDNHVTLSYPRAAHHDLFPKKFNTQAQPQGALSACT